MKEQTQYVDKPLIKNTAVERLGFRIANDDESETFVRLATKPDKLASAHATAFFSKKIVPVYEYLADEYEQRNGVGSLELVKKIVYRANSRRT